MAAHSCKLPTPVPPVKQRPLALNHRLSHSGSGGKPGRSGGACSVVPGQVGNCHRLVRCLLWPPAHTTPANCSRKVTSPAPAFVRLVSGWGQGFGVWVRGGAHMAAAAIRNFYASPSSPVLEGNSKTEHVGPIKAQLQVTVVGVPARRSSFPWHQGITPNPACSCATWRDTPRTGGNAGNPVS